MSAECGVRSAEWSRVASPKGDARRADFSGQRHPHPRECNGSTIPHSAFRIPHSPSATPHSALATPHSR